MPGAVADSAVTADLHYISVGALLGRYEFDAAIAVPRVEPV
jgi:hypothetical protein